MMKSKLFILLFITSLICQAQTICNAGFAAGYPCHNIDLFAHLSIAQLGGDSDTKGNDIWGWTDPLNNKEYALVGLTSHTAFVDITNPTNPIYLGKLPTQTTSSIWRDIKVYNNYAFIVSEAAGHGMQVFDLTRLRNVTTPIIFTNDAHYADFGNAHNIAINEATGYAYAIGTSTFNGGPHFINIQNPLMPIAAGGYGDEDYTHDAQIINYTGVDATHVGKEIFFGANEDKVVILDVTNKTNPILLSVFNYDNTGYSHQCWLTEDQKYLILGDELDEIDFGFNTKNIIINVSDLDNPSLKWDYFGETTAIDHNGYTKGNDYYLANYRAGMRIMDITNIDAENMNEIAFFDTFPSSDSASFNGAWSVYPYFTSQSILISDIESGLFVVKKNAALSNNSFSLNESKFDIYPNPLKNTLFIKSENDLINTVSILSVEGRKVYEAKGSLLNNQQIDVSGLEKGIYFILINESNITKGIKE